MKKYFEKPTQVMFADPDNEGEWIVGIAYKDEIICACCGGIFEIEELMELSEKNEVIYPYEDWIDITYEIDSELPKGLENKDGKIVRAKE